MKRARIKATVTVPTRRKTTQENVNTESTSTTDCIEKSNNEVNDTSSILQQQTSEDNVQETQPQDVPITVEQIKIEMIHENVSLKNGIKRSFDELSKEIIQPLENTNTTELGSPTKLSQSRLSFMRPVPKLNSSGRVRRNSVQGSGASASESEDDSKRTNSIANNHTKNDLVHTAEATKDTVVNNTKMSSLTKSKMGQKRRVLVSESARKLADARREFNLKHENKIPDRSKLTMYDLIHYNPVTNPMKKSKDSETVARKLSTCQPDELQEEENEDDPSSAMPVPQVKVGPDGQLIIDEQSLVIEQTNAKKNREMLAKEAIIDDDTGGGFYKKRQKSKEWPKWETLKFYKALNTVGTDFLLMQSLFPNRTRQEIKIKFKKEEKINRNLIEKALEYHQEFDTELLEKSFALLEKSEKEFCTTQEKKKQKLSRNFEKIKKADRKRRCRIVATSIAEMDASDEEEGSDSKVQNENIEDNEHQQSLKKTHKKKRKKIKDEKRTSEVPLMETEDVESLSVCSGFDSDTEIYHVRPTRSGRLPKVKKLQGPDINTLDNERLNYDSSDQECTTLPKNTTKDLDNIVFENANSNPEMNYANSVKTVIPNISNVEPGSLLILSKESPEEPGKSVLQVYMISSNVNSSENIKEQIATPTNLPPELLATVTTRLSNAESIAVKEEYE
ncbi:transcription factor TFIIIB component B'' homolog Bdp1 [Megalopta genalis]|uniref:transcription factor TFIIIB component B'' homolog Bdp1 n=1 Tax=Megalopta genalis TaxID=115081 RepID=UPI0014437D5A|nr:transcription factor TFIIIB component B'' [Megalopta genalis]